MHNFLSYQLALFRSRHWGQREFELDNLRKSGVDESMLKEAYPLGIPQPIRGGDTIDLTSDGEDEKDEKKDIKTEVKEEPKEDKEYHKNMSRVEEDTKEIIKKEDC